MITIYNISNIFVLTYTGKKANVVWRTDKSRTWLYFKKCANDLCWEPQFV